MPDYLEGVFTEDAGIVLVKEALRDFKDHSIKNGADLRYNTEVVNIDHEKGIVTLEDGS